MPIRLKPRLWRRLIAPPNPWAPWIGLCAAGWVAGAMAQNFCQPLAMDPDVPAGMQGRYALIGVHPGTQQPFSGTIDIRLTPTHYALTQRVHRRVRQGTAQWQACGPDQVRYLMVQYHHTGGHQALCRLGSGGDNDYRLTCTTRHRPTATRYGMEAWFQQP